MNPVSNEYGTQLMVAPILCTKKGNERKNRVKIKRDGLFGMRKQYGDSSRNPKEDHVERRNVEDPKRLESFSAGKNPVDL